jgi:peptidoglycan LD-endopeptidase LytH
MTIKLFLILTLLVMLSLAYTQVLPDGADGVPFECPPPENVREPANEAERLEFERRAAYRAFLPAYLAAVPTEPDTSLFMPVEGITVSQIADTWGAPRSGRRVHEGQDIFANEGTPIYAAAPGYIYRIGEGSALGGNTITVIVAGGHRHYYAHLQDFSTEIREGQSVDTDTLLGYVGKTGNAATTPPHLHFGVYVGEAENLCDWDAINPLPLLTDR